MPAQPSIVSFFKKRKLEDNKVDAKASENKPLETKNAEPRPSRPGAGSLKDFERGGSGTASVNDDYRKKFREHFLGAKPIKSLRREMKPFDLQFIELKRKHMEAILMVQNGYKYQILGEDAYRAARFLGRTPIAGWRDLDPGSSGEDGLYDRFASLTFPIERLPYYVDKLVMQGLKVSVAKQLETSALKQQSTNKRGPFRREVTNTYTKGTLVEELTSSSEVSGPILAITQTNNGIALVACQPATGYAVYDEFKTGDLAVELETRLMHIQPSEVLILGSLEGVSKRLVNALGVRTEIVKTKDLKDETSALDRCWAALHEYLAEFNLSDALKLKAEPFSLKSFMHLDGNTLSSLDIFENQTNGEKVGSLFWALDNTSTPFGKRMLRHWIGKPLLDRGMLSERVEAMEEIMFAEGPKLTMFQSLQNALKRMPDLERHTLQIFHNRIEPRQLYWHLYFLNVLAQSITEPQLRAAKVTSPQLLAGLEKLHTLRDIVGPLIVKIDAQKVRQARDTVDITQFFDMHYFLDGNEYKDDELSTEFKKLKDTTFEIGQVRHDFETYITEESEKLGITLKHVRAQGEEDTFVIGVPKKEASKVPTTWRRQGAITSEVRFWSPESLERTKVLKPLLEIQALLAQKVYELFVAKIRDEHFDFMRSFVRAIGELDCLFSLAQVSARPNYVKPDLVDEKCLVVEEGRHPVLEQLMLSSFVPNSASMYDSKNRVMLITGPNMGGKSSFVRQMALLVIMAQIGCYVPAASARMSIVDGVWTRMGAFDNLMRGESTFFVELQQCAAILARATPRSLVILDEIGRGTSTMDGVAIANAVLQYMITDVKCFTLFITHYQWLCQEAAQNEPYVQNWSMDCAESEDEVVFLYRIVPHAASRSYGINVARLAGLPAEVLTAAQEKSAEFEQSIEQRRACVELRNRVAACLRGEIAPEKLRLEFTGREVVESQN